MNENNQEDKKPQDSETLHILINFLHVGVTMATSVLVGVLLGKYLDSLFGTAPWLLLFFSLAGVGAAIMAVFNMGNAK